MRVLHYSIMVKNNVNALFPFLLLLAPSPRLFLYQFVKVPLQLIRLPQAIVFQLSPDLFNLPRCRRRLICQTCLSRYAAAGVFFCLSTILQNHSYLNQWFLKSFPGLSHRTRKEKSVLPASRLLLKSTSRLVYAHTFISSWVFLLNGDHRTNHYFITVSRYFALNRF